MSILRRHVAVPASVGLSAAMTRDDVLAFGALFICAIALFAFR